MAVAIVWTEVCRKLRMLGTKFAAMSLGVATGPVCTPAPMVSLKISPGRPDGPSSPLTAVFHAPSASPARSALMVPDAMPATY